MGAEESAYEQRRSQQREVVESKKETPAMGDAAIQPPCAIAKVNASDYHGVAFPINVTELQKRGWNFVGQGLPIYVKLPSLGAGFVAGSMFDEFGTRWFAVGVYDIALDGSSTRPAVSAAYTEPIKCNTLWQVRGDYVEHPDMVVKSLSSDASLSGGLKVSLLCRGRKKVEDDETDEPTISLYPYEKNLSWAEFLDYERRPGTPENLALILFRTDNASKFMTEPRWYAEIAKEKDVAKTPVTIAEPPKVVAPPEEPVTGPSSSPPPVVDKSEAIDKTNVLEQPHSSSSLVTGYRYIEPGVGSPFTFDTS